MKIVVTGPKGKMGKLILKEAAERENIEITGAVGPAGRIYIGQDAGIATGLGIEIGAKVYDSIEEIICDCDVVVDFSTVELSMEILRSCVKHKKALVCGTTGFSKEQETELTDAGKLIPFMKAANTSYVTNVMKKLLSVAAEALGSKAKIEIIDMHDEKKADAPSGTAKELAAEMAEASGKNISEIQHHSVRAGDISSVHKVIFGCMGERLEISHHAYSFACYAIGAIDAAEFLEGKAPGLYTMDDVININR